ncbi:hypothetical protein EAI91_06540 [Lacticaseibacillus paracasei]|uniref:Uncharacterized protein n=1 Tax=Lacticaseibacillus paracasei TaxID=1597 RepID=A0AB38Q870_LACPA|nr:hypothetical protein CYL78_14840 [Lacticaseibacillus paracasei subsp. tolerans]MCS6150296.1 hypothetical protein [Lacticaseibacillus paracasei]PTS57484.1 hypothetical protein DBQ61_05845 [Lactobacillus sp. DS22_6]MCT3320108.1 hypothetical protein [Lacticaseibacillus paracasei]MCT3355279.1 hypothetical protein [Lacticaseibacillus paracasei]
MSCSFLPKRKRVRRRRNLHIIRTPKPKWPKPSLLGLGPLRLRFLTAPARALQISVCRNIII